MWPFKRKSESPPAPRQPIPGETRASASTVSSDPARYLMSGYPTSGMLNGQAVDVSAWGPGSDRKDHEHTFAFVGTHNPGLLRCLICECQARLAL